MSNNLELELGRDFGAAIADCSQKGGLRVRIENRWAFAQYVCRKNPSMGRPLALFRVPGEPYCFEVTLCLWTRQLLLLNRTKCGVVLPFHPQAA